MLRNVATLGFFKLAAFVTVQATVPRAVPFSDYGLETIQWGFPTPQGEIVFFNGTAQEAAAQLVTKYPDISPFKEDGPCETPHAPTLTKRVEFSSFNCLFGNYGDCFRIGIIEGIQYLRSLKGQPTNGPGPGNCGRVSCSYGNAIFWCNDDRTSKTLDGWASIADGAQFIVNHCSEGGPGKAYTHGQAFHAMNWNVIVRHDNC